MGMFPDVQDVERSLRNFPGPKPTAESIWPDVVLARSFLDEACGRCRNHGRHQFVSVADIKKFAESFTGRAIHDFALKVAMRMQGLQTKSSGSDKSILLVKVPPLDRFGEARELWTKHQIEDLEKDIAEEKIRMEQEKTIRAKYQPK